MIPYPEMDPVAFGIGKLQVHWYGLMYLAGFACAWALAMYRAGKPWAPVKRNQVEDMIVWAAVGVIVGGRCGYVFIYGMEQFLEDPVWLFKVWTGGMSFHGGLIGVILAMSLYAWRIRVNFLSLMDFGAPLVPLGLGFGRLGNFIGQELWGRPVSGDVPWAMVFPNDPEQLARHPSQLYEAGLEGVLLFIILFVYSAKPRARGTVGALFLICYGCFRFFVEFYREPDQHIMFDFMGWVTRGQWLSSIMVASGLVLFVLFVWRAARLRRAEQDAASGQETKADSSVATKA
ncbi:prolipoprotein diacylglyceryl transferase [Halioxenophilus sp. WMMB6]|uniref:prolipoprotein diacylglyceryl transferase n=1 Tax=Halioxenophilus sp. WMMB6 TaxID=3073815 RepID=UPI00295ED8C3|nr:prolipoprotein diacylglyceryl transferase [Halioxenophilus sp. WMMB6]